MLLGFSISLFIPLKVSVLEVSQTHKGVFTPIFTHLKKLIAFIYLLIYLLCEHMHAAVYIQAEVRGPLLNVRSLLAESGTRGHQAWWQQLLCHLPRAFTFVGSKFIFYLCASGHLTPA